MEKKIATLNDVCTISSGFLSHYANSVLYADIYKFKNELIAWFQQKTAKGKTFKNTIEVLNVFCAERKKNKKINYEKIK